MSGQTIAARFSSSCPSGHEVATRNVPAAQVLSTAFGFRVWKGGVEQWLCLANHSLHPHCMRMSIDALTERAQSVVSAAEPDVHVPAGRFRRAKWCCIQGNRQGALAEPESRAMAELWGLSSRNCGSLLLFLQRLTEHLQTLRATVISNYS